jgi:hypothetical protein
VSLLRYTTIAACAAVATGAAVLAVTPPAARLAVGLGLVIATLNTIAAFALATRAEGRPVKAFLRAILGGTAARMTLMLGAVAAAVVWLKVPSVPLALSLLGYFVAFLVFELAILHRRASARTVAS